MNNFNENNCIPQANLKDFQQRNFNDLEAECREKMKATGFDFDGGLVADGIFQRLSIDGGHDQDEWYVANKSISLSGREKLMCAWGTYAGGQRTLGSYNSYASDKTISSEELSTLNEEESEWKKATEEQAKREQKERIRKAQREWEEATEEPTDHYSHLHYLSHKKVGRHGIKFGKAWFKDGQDADAGNPTANQHPTLVIPLRNINGETQAVQHIRADGNKRIHGPKKGCFHVIGQITQGSEIYVAEGYATAASVYVASGSPSVMAIDCGNLDLVIAALRTKYPNRIIIAGDDDVETDGNPGKSKAEVAAKKYCCKVVFPKFPEDFRLAGGKRPTDWNDLHVHFGLDEVGKQLAFAFIPTDTTDRTNDVVQIAGEWGKPVEFEDKLFPVPTFDPLLLPDPLRSYAIDVADRMQCPIDFVAAPLLVIFSSLIGAGCAIRPKTLDNWSVIPNLWGGIVGPPSVMKSPALSEAMIPLGELEKIADEKYKDDCLAGEVDLIEIKMRKEKITSDLKSAIKKESEREIESCKTAFARLEKEVRSVIWKRYKTNDATIEKIGEILKENPRGLLVYRDELIGFLVTLDKDGREGDRAFYLEGWNGYSSSSVKSDRIGRGTISSNPCISVLGGIQPSKLRQYLSEAIMDIANDGLIQRFQVIVYPDTPKNYRFIDRKPDWKAREKIINIAKTLAKTDFVSLGAKNDEYFPLPIFHFDSSAQEFFNAWLVQHQTRLLAEFDEGIFVEHLGKYRKLMPSLALINYLIRVANGDTPSAVSLEDVQRAAKQCAYLEPHAKRVYSILDQQRVSGAKSLIKKLRDRLLPDRFTQRDVYRKGWSGLSKLDNVIDVCGDLVERGWLKEEKVPTTPQGGAPTIRYRIHPSLLKMVNSQSDTSDKTPNDKVVSVMSVPLPSDSEQKKEEGL